MHCASMMHALLLVLLIIAHDSEQSRITAKISIFLSKSIMYDSNIIICVLLIAHQCAGDLLCLLIYIHYYSHAGSK